MCGNATAFFFVFFTTTNAKTDSRTTHFGKQRQNVQQQQRRRFVCVWFRFVVFAAFETHCLLSKSKTQRRRRKRTICCLLLLKHKLQTKKHKLGQFEFDKTKKTKKMQFSNNNNENNKGAAAVQQQQQYGGKVWSNAPYRIVRDLFQFVKTTTLKREAVRANRRWREAAFSELRRRFPCRCARSATYERCPARPPPP